MKRQGFDRALRGVGIRDYQLILPSVVCSTRIASRIANEVGSKTFAHQHGCGIIGNDVEGISDFFCDLAKHPNVGTVLIVGLGCETIQGNELAAKVKESNPTTSYLVIQESGGVAGTFNDGITAAKLLKSTYPPHLKNLDELVVGVEFSNSNSEIESLIAELKASGIKFEIADQDKNPGLNFSELMRRGVHLIVSFTEPNQPPSGFPLIPTINIASDSALHSALAKEFDLPNGSTSSAILNFILDVADGKETKSELSKAGEIIAPRVVRSV
jgi:altronate dehydratase